MEEVSEKFCPWCEETKPTSEFALDRSKKDGYYYVCKTCKRADDKRRRDDPVIGKRLREKNRQWLREHPERARAMRRRNRIKKLFGLTTSDYDSLVEGQGGVCAICGDPPRPEDPGGVLSVDHDHETGAIRGLLCHRCNRGLGQFRDDAGVLAKALVYLRADGPARV